MQDKIHPLPLRQLGADHSTGRAASQNQLEEYGLRGQSGRNGNGNRRTEKQTRRRRVGLTQKQGKGGEALI